MPLSNPSQPAVPDSLHVDALRLDEAGVGDHRPDRRATAPAFYHAVGFALVRGEIAEGATTTTLGGGLIRHHSEIGL